MILYLKVFCQLKITSKLLQKCGLLSPPCCMTLPRCQHHQEMVADVTEQCSWRHDHHHHQSPLPLAWANIRRWHSCLHIVRSCVMTLLKFLQKFVRSHSSRPAWKNSNEPSAGDLMDHQQVTWNIICSTFERASPWRVATATGTVLSRLDLFMVCTNLQELFQQNFDACHSCKISPGDFWSFSLSTSHKTLNVRVLPVPLPHSKTFTAGCIIISGSYCVVLTHFGGCTSDVLWEIRQK